MKLTEHRLQDMSKIEVRYFTRPSSKKTYLSVLVIKYAGVYRRGSAGNPDATYMRAMAKASIDALGPWCVIHDLSELSYEWGNRIVDVFLGPEMEPAPLPIAIVLGPNCEPGFPSLFALLANNEYVERGDKVYFRSLEAAWNYVDARITESDY